MREQFIKLKPFLRGMPFVFLCCLLGMILASVYLRYSNFVYSATSKLQLANPNKGIQSTQLYKDWDYFTGDNQIITEIEVIKSDVILKKALEKSNFQVEYFLKGDIRTLELYEDCPFMVSFSGQETKLMDRLVNLSFVTETEFELFIPSLNESYTGNVGEVLFIYDSELLISMNDKLFSAKPGTDTSGDYQFVILSEEKLLAKVRSNLSLKSIDKEVPIVMINFKSNNPTKAAILPNLIAETYIRDFLDSRFLNANTTVQFLNKQIDSIQDRLLIAEKELEQYKFGNSVVNLTQETETLVRKLASMKVSETNLNVKLSSLEKVLELVESSKDDYADLIIDVESSTFLLVTETFKDINKLRAQYRSLSKVYTPNDNRLINIRQDIKGLEDFLHQSLITSRASLVEQIEILGADIKVVESELKSYPEKDKWIDKLNREMDIYENTYILLNEKKIEAELTRAATISFHRIITYAKLSDEPIAPNQFIVKLIAFFFSMILGLVLLIIFLSIHSKVEDTVFVNARTTVEVVARFEKHTEEISTKYFMESFGELQLRQQFQKNKILCFTSLADTWEVQSIIEDYTKVLIGYNYRVAVLNYSEAVYATDDKDLITIIKPLHENLNTWQDKDKQADYLHSIRNEYDFIFIHNVDWNSIGFSMNIALADETYLILNSRISKLSSLKEVEEFMDIYEVDEIYYIFMKIKSLYYWKKRIAKNIERFKLFIKRLKS